MSKEIALKLPKKMTIAGGAVVVAGGLGIAANAWDVPHKSAVEIRDEVKQKVTGYYPEQMEDAINTRKEYRNKLPEIYDESIGEPVIVKPWDLQKAEDYYEKHEVIYGIGQNFEEALESADDKSVEKARIAIGVSAIALFTGGAIVLYSEKRPKAKSTKL